MNQREVRTALICLAVIFVAYKRMASYNALPFSIDASISLKAENKTKEPIKLPPIQGKIPVCTTPQNNQCVKPAYPTPEVVECLVRERQKIDDSGAWRLPRNFMYKFDQSFADGVVERVISGSVLELGAGLGCYTSYFHGSGRISAIKGYEGAVNVEDLTEGFIKHQDLTVKVDWGEQFDWVVCMEVAEHIPMQYEPIFILNIVSAAQKGVLLSWGQPGQNGVGHVNLRTNEYVIDMMKGLGFKYDKERSEYLRSKAQFPWFQGTTMVFLNEAETFVHG